jgi:hypothetical protein
MRPCHVGALPEPLPSLIIAAATPSSPQNVLEASLRGEQNPSAPFPFLCSQHRPRELIARPTHPLPTSSTVDAQAFPLTPLACSHASPLCVALTRARFGRREHLPRLAPAKRRRAPSSLLCPGVPTAAPRLHASWVVRFMMDGQDRIPLRFKRLVHHGLVDHVYGAVHRRRPSPVRVLDHWIKDPRLRSAAASVKDRYGEPERGGVNGSR